MSQLDIRQVFNIWVPYRISMNYETIKYGDIVLCIIIPTV